MVGLFRASGTVSAGRAERNSSNRVSQSRVIRFHHHLGFVSDVFVRNLFSVPSHDFANSFCDSFSLTYLKQFVGGERVPIHHFFIQTNGYSVNVGIALDKSGFQGDLARRESLCLFYDV